MAGYTVIGMLGVRKDAGTGPGRWKRWRPSVSLCQHPKLPIGRFLMLHEKPQTALAEQVAADIRSVSPGTRVQRIEVPLRDPWDFEQVFTALHDLAHKISLDTPPEQLLIHVNTGTHVTRICLFLLTESRHFPARLLQSVPPRQGRAGSHGGYRIIDLNLGRYDQIAARFEVERDDAVSFLKSGIKTRNPEFNRLIDQIERVALRSTAPMLLTGPTGAGKSHLARRLYELKRNRGLVAGPFVEVNCATLRGELAPATLFGHERGAFTGATMARKGLLRTANKGILFLDEIGELGANEQAMLLRALEEKTLLPLGGDQEVTVEFQLLGGTNCDLHEAVAAGAFREDLLARIDLWAFQLPGLRDRPEDIEPNIDFELTKLPRVVGVRVTFSQEARREFLEFAESQEALWTRNFRDLNGAMTRMATLARGGRITVGVVHEEIKRLKSLWHREPRLARGSLVERTLGEHRAGQLDHFDRVQLEEVLRVCARSHSLSEAGRRLFARSRLFKTTRNDAHRLRQYLGRHGIDPRDVLASR